MKTRPNTSSLGRKLDSSSLIRSAFTLVELLTVVAIMALAMGALLPTLKGFFDSARLPDARNLISSSLTGARNYAVANTVTTALVFSEDEAASANKRRIRMYLARYNATDDKFEEVPGRKTTYLPDNVLISNDATKDTQGGEDTVVICFSTVGQLIIITGTDIDINNPPIPTIGSQNSRANFWLYDDSVNDSPMESFQINYYTGAVIKP